MFRQAAARLDGGTYSTKRALQYLGHQRFREVLAMVDQIQTLEEFFNLLSQRPQDWKLYVYHYSQPNENWRPGVHPPFPREGLKLW